MYTEGQKAKICFLLCNANKKVKQVLFYFVSACFLKFAKLLVSYKTQCHMAAISSQILQEICGHYNNIYFKYFWKRKHERNS